MEKKFNIIKEGRLDYPTPEEGFTHIYVLYNDKNKVAYVGQTSNLFGRIGQHAQAKKFGTITWFQFFVVESKDALIAEQYYIYTLNPLFNPYSHYEKKQHVKVRKCSELQMNLKEYLQYKSMSAGELAKKIGYCRETIQNYVTGKIRLSPRAAHWIEDATEGMVPYERTLSENPLGNYGKTLKRAALKMAAAIERETNGEVKAEEV